MRGPRRGVVGFLVAIVLVAVLLEVADVIARHVAEDTVSARAVRATGASSASTSISGWPILWDFFAQGTIPSVSMELHDVTIGRPGAPVLVVQEIDVALTKVGVSAGDLVGHRELRLTGIKRAEVDAIVTQAELSTAAGATVKVLPGGRVGVETPGGLVSAAVAVHGNVLVLSEGSKQLFSIDLTQDRLIPRCRMTTSTSAGRIVASCSIAPVPPSLLAALSAQA
jgi:hypothetical protein